MRRGWWEDYRCGCVSETVRTKRELLGYCPKHGDERRHVWREGVPSPERAARPEPQEEQTP